MPRGVCHSLLIIKNNISLPRMRLLDIDGCDNGRWKEEIY